MSTTTILLLNLDPSPELAGALRAILKASPGQDIELHEESFAGAAPGDGVLAALASTSRAQAILLVLAPDPVENEFFGHERSAYTGASSAQSGLIEEADGGTLFLGSGNA
ncbi:MAG: sigma-54 factor interaction domain-containing protein, partial [bacterium]|nr:sigma-54 factor interaction domain-containing protein [bacterium]